MAVISVALVAGLASMPPLVRASTDPGWMPQRYVPAPPDSALKGFVSYPGFYGNFPHSLEYSYVAWKDIQTDVNVFTWTSLDATLADAASRHHQLIFRVYADFPDLGYGVPAFLSNIVTHPYNDWSNGTHATSVSPDYENPAVVRAMTNTIRALGARYDGDPRLAFVAVGFLGFWGEWHTWRPSCSCNPWMASPHTQRAVLDAFTEAFHRTKLVMRYPDVGWSGQKIGFHDDQFSDQTIDPPDWMFLGRMKTARATRQWRTQSIGGEIEPIRQWCAFSRPTCLAQSYDESVDLTHASWLMNHYAFATGYLDGDRQRAFDAARRLGYELFVSAVDLPATVVDRLHVVIRIQNRGVAPFPYDWKVQLAARNSNGVIIAAYDTDWRLTKIIDRGVDMEWTDERQVQLEPGAYTLLMRAVNPLASGMPLVFANAGWSADAPNWLTLGTFEVRPR